MESEDRPLAEDLACPVQIEPSVDHATPEDWSWSHVGSSQPNSANFHLTHSDVSQVMVDVLRPSDSPPDGQFKLSRDIPIIVMDTVDKYWAAESRTQLPLNGLRVAVEGETVAEAKRALAADMAAQLRLLMLLASSRNQLATELQENLRFYLAIMNTDAGASTGQG